MCERLLIVHPPHLNASSLIFFLFIACHKLVVTRPGVNILEPRRVDEVPPIDCHSRILSLRSAPAVLSRTLVFVACIELTAVCWRQKVSMLAAKIFPAIVLR